MVKFRKLIPIASSPKRATEGAAGFDLVSTSKKFEVFPNGKRQITYGTGLAIEIPFGYVGILVSRSSISKMPLVHSNPVGIIDSDYRGEVRFKVDLDFNTRPTQDSSYKVGDRVCQLVIVPCCMDEMQEVNELNDTSRGSGGFGSTNE